MDFDLDRVVPDKSKIAGRRRDRALDQAALPATGDGYAALRAHERHSHGCAVPRSDVRAAQRDARWRQEGRFRRREGIFRLARAQKIQAARARFSQPLPRLRHMPGLPRHASARRSSRGENRGPLDHRSLPDDGEGRPAVLRELAAEPKPKPRSPKKCWKKFSSACVFSTKWASTISRSTGLLPRSPAARRSASSWPRRWVRIWSGALYVLDEPSIGLHPRDTTRLIEILKGLRDLGNTLLVVEHDPGHNHGRRSTCSIWSGRRRARRQIDFCRHARRRC